MIAPLLLRALALPFLSASLSIGGQVRDSATQTPIANVVVVNVATHERSVTDGAGRFALPGHAPARLRFTRDGYATREIEATSDSGIVVLLVHGAQSLERVTVTALRAGGTAPISEKTIDRADIERRYAGQEVPLVLQTAPSMTAYAETGTYWGYSYMRLRGIDQSRINLTLDGIPLNDPEDQVLYFADFPDLANSVESVQIQRGVGTSALGTSSYAGSVNFETIPLASSRRGGEAQVEVGSFGAKRASLEYQTGLLPGRFAAYARVSALDENGYRYHSGVLGRSAFLSVGYFGDRDIVKLTATAGLLRDTLSYLAVPVSVLDTNRRVNPLQPTELDKFGEQLVALAYTRLLGPTSSLSTTAYRISASGDYDVFIDPDLWNFNLDFAWYGVTSAWNWSRGGLKANVGVNANSYARDHYLFIRPDLRTRIYTNTGHKDDASGFAKLSWSVGRATLFGDLQGRWARFRYSPDAQADIPASSIDWRFFNPKVGATWQLTSPLGVYASYGINGREPARSDMFAGFDNLDTSNVAFVGGFDRVRPEQVRDLELGLQLRTRALDVQANAFDMRFRNEILPIGQLSYIGTPLRKNVRASRRRGVELDATWRPTSRLTLGGNVALNHSRIAEYTDDASATTYRDIEPLLTPRVIANQRLDVAATRRLRFAVDGRYMGESQLTNTGDRSFVLPASYLLDATAAFAVGSYELAVHGNNLTDAKKYSSGYSDGATSYYYVVPPRNVMVTLKVGF